MALQTFSTSPNRINVPATTLTTSLAVAPNAAIDCLVYWLLFANTTGGAVTVTVQDGNGKKLLNAVSIAAGSALPIAGPLGGLSENGTFFKGGLFWSASANASIDAWADIQSF